MGNICSSSESYKYRGYKLSWYKEAQSGIAVWLDDERDPQSDIGRQKGASGSETWVKTAPEAIQLLENGNVASISLDHDLGPDENGSGYDVAKWIEEQAYHGNLPRLQWAVHSDNPVGVKNMRAALEQANKFWERNELTKKAQAIHERDEHDLTYLGIGHPNEEWRPKTRDTSEFENSFLAWVWDGERILTGTEHSSKIGYMNKRYAGRYEENNEEKRV